MFVDKSSSRQLHSFTVGAAEIACLKISWVPTVSTILPHATPTTDRLGHDYKDQHVTRLPRGRIRVWPSGSPMSSAIRGRRPKARACGTASSKDIYDLGNINSPLPRYHWYRDASDRDRRRSRREDVISVSSPPTEATVTGQGTSPSQVRHAEPAASRFQQTAIVLLGREQRCRSYGRRVDVRHARSASLTGDEVEPRLSTNISGTAEEVKGKICGSERAPPTPVRRP